MFVCFFGTVCVCSLGLHACVLFLYGTVCVNLCVCNMMCVCINHVHILICACACAHVCI